VCKTFAVSNELLSLSLSLPYRGKKRVYHHHHHHPQNNGDREREVYKSPFKKIWVRIRRNCGIH